MISVVLLACTATPPLSRDALVSYSGGILQQLDEEVAGLPVSWSLEDAVARALSHNSELRIKTLEIAIASGNHRLASRDMLPQLAAQAGYSSRSKALASSSESIESGSQSLVSSTSSDKQRSTAKLDVTWNILDFALAFYRAKELNDQVLLIAEQRRQVQQNLLTDVVHAWWRAWVYQALYDDLKVARQQVEAALTQAQTITERRLRDPVAVIEYRKALFYVLRRLDTLALDLDTARDELARLLDLPAGMPLRLSGGEDVKQHMVSHALPSAPLQHWQLAALVNRPELRISLYEGRITASEAKRSLWGLLPSLGFRVGTNYDDNSFLLHNRWHDSAISASMNLLKLASIQGRRRHIKLTEELAELHDRAMLVAVLSQVAVADKSYQQNKQNWCISKQLSELDSQRQQLLEAKTQVASMDKLSLIRARVDNLLLRTEVAMDFADLQRDQMTLLMSAGLLEMPAEKEEESFAVTIKRWLYNDMASVNRAELDSISAEFNVSNAAVKPKRESRCEF